jgi:biopolymer transport protein ExbD
MSVKKRSKVTAEFNMSSLTDIIFLLLIFFMLTSNLASPNVHNLKLPNSTLTTPSPQTFGLSINADGEYFIEKEKVVYEQLEEKLLERVNKEYQQRGEKPEDINPDTGEKNYLTVVLNVDATVGTGKIVEIMQLANRAGARLILATTPVK